jgi:hypothetical protein
VPLTTSYGAVPRPLSSIDSYWKTWRSAPIILAHVAWRLVAFW